MPETVSRILIKSSTSKPTPNTGTLQRAELAYSYSSDKLFIGDELGQEPLLIGGKTFLSLFDNVLDDSGTAKAGQVFAGNVIIAGANNTIDDLNIENLKVNGVPLATANITEVITSNTLPNVADTKLVSAKAVKEYIGNEWLDYLETISANTVSSGQLLIVGANNKFENKSTTGAIKFFANGHSEINNSYIENSMLKNFSIRLGSQDIKLGDATLVNLNLDTSGVLNVNRGGTDRHDIEKDHVMLGNGTNAVSTTSDFVFNIDTANNNLLYANANAHITKSATVGETLQVANGLFTSNTNLRFKEFFQIINIENISSFDSSIVSYDLISEYFSFSTGTVLNVSDAGLVNIKSPTLFFGSELTTSNNTVTTLTGKLFANNDSSFNGNTLTVSTDTITTFDGPVTLNNNTFINGNNLNVSTSTVTTVDGLVTLNNNTFINGTTLNVSVDTTSTFEGVVNLENNTFVNGNTLNVSANTLSTFDGPIVLNGQVDINGDVVFRGNTTYLGETFTVSNNTTVDISGNTFFKGDQLNVSSNTITTVDGESTFNKKVDINAPLTVYDNAEVKGNLVVEQDLFVYGNSTQILTETLTVEDNIIVLAANNTTDVVDLGFAGRYNESGTPAFAGLFRDATNNKFFLFEDYPTEPPITSMVGFDSATMLATLFADIEANTIIAHKGTLDDVVITNSHLNDSFANNLTSNNATLNNANIYDSFANNLTANVSTLNNANIYNSFANNLTANVSTLNDATIHSSTITNSHLNDSFANNLTSNNATLNNANIYDSFAENLTANTIVANTYSGIQLSMIQNLNDTATANQVLTTDGSGNFFFNSTGVSNELKGLVDVNSTATANQVLTADGSGSFFFAAASDPISVKKTNTSNAILSTVTNVNDFRFDSDSGLDVVDLGSGAVKIKMNSTFKTLKVSGQSDLVATGLDTLEIIGGVGITITTNPTGTPHKTLTFNGVSLLTDLGITDGTANQVLTTDGSGNFSFENTVAELKQLTDLESTAAANEILTAYGNGQFFFANTLTDVSLQTSNAVEEFKVLGVTGTSGKLVLNCSNNSHGQTIIAQPHANNVTNVLTLPAGGDQEIVGTIAEQTLTNKTLISSTVNTAIINDSSANNLTSNNTTLGGTTTFNGNTTITENLTVNKDLTVDGNLFLTGNTVTLDAQTLTVEDNIILLSSNNAADVTDTGFAGKYNNGSSDLYAGIFRDATDGVFYIFKDYTSEPGTTMAGFNTATMRATLAGDFEANNIVVDSGSFENVTSNNATITNSTISDTVIDCGTF